MNKVIDIPIVGPSNNVPQDDPQRTLNFYPEKTGDAWTLKPTPGAVRRYNLAIGGGGRGAISIAGRLFGVRGSFLQEIVAGAPVARGVMLSSQNKVQIIGFLPPNGNGQILIVDDANGYVFELASNTFTTLTEADHGFVGGLSQAAFVSGYGVVINPGTNQVRYSDLYNFLSWPALNFASTESTVGNLVALASAGSSLYLWTVNGFEVWSTENYSPPYVFTPVVDGFQIGCEAPDSVYSFEKWVYWLGGNDAGKGVVYRYTNGGTPQRVSDHSTERQIAAISDPSDAIGYCYQSLGHVFYILTFINGNQTLCWDKTTSQWHDRAWRDASTNYMFAVPYVTALIHDGQLLGLDRRNGTFFEIDNNTYTDDGAPIRRERTLPVVPEEADWMTVCVSVELFATVGNTPVPTETVVTSVVAGTSLATNPTVYNPLALFLHVGYYLDTNTFIAFAFSSSAARAAYLAGLDFEGFLGIATGDMTTTSQLVTIQNGAGVDLVSFTLLPVTPSVLPVSFDIMQRIEQADNNPRIMLKYSKDRGMTYGQEVWQQAGGNSSYAARTRWTGLGAAFGFVFNFAIVSNQYVSWRSVRMTAQ